MKLRRNSYVRKGINEGSRFYEGLPIDDPKALLMKRTDTCTQFTGSSGKVNAVSVNPVDTKLRQDNGIRNALRILGFDGVGKVVAVGDEVQNFLSAIAFLRRYNNKSRKQSRIPTS